MKTKSHLILISIFSLLFTFRGYGQSYGLGFYSHEVVQDQRTGLDLSPDKTLCLAGNFELSFDLTFLPKHDDYFGYILRFVVGDKENVDLIYDKNPLEKNHFKIIIGDKFSKIAFDIPEKNLFNNWNKITIKFDLEAGSMYVYSGKYAAKANLSLSRNDCFKILFGANEYKGFKTGDIPPMKIRNVRISEQDQPKYDWPLDEYSGNIAKEKIHGNDASVIKPLWIKKMHYQWQLLKTISADGPASIAFDAENDVLHIVGSKSLKDYYIKDGRLKVTPYHNQLNLLRGNHSIYIAESNKLFNFYTDQKAVSLFDTAEGKWSNNFSLPTPITDYWQFNKFYCPKDSSLYVIGGYGHFIYKNEIQQYHFPSATWKNVKTKGDVFTPRYLAALGFDGKGAYIIGGYGSTTGQQMLNPRNLYDMMYFDVEKKTIKKIYELNIKGEDFVFANSLILEEKSKSYYGLIFPKHKYESGLQLIEGSLTKPEFKYMGSKIPYVFHDINSYADLFYSTSGKKFIAVTMLRGENDQTSIHIYSLYSPPIEQQAAVISKTSKTALFILSACLLVLVLVGLLMYWRKKNTQKPFVAQSAPAMLPVENIAPVTPPVLKEPVTKSAVFLFGDLQVFNDDRNDITKQFTPLIKELFLVILLYTIRWERGISSDKLKELLWFDKSADSARNNRSVNIAKLKSILEKVGDCQISKETGYWRININAARTYVDYQQYINIVKDKNKLNREKITELAEIIKRGSFLSVVNYEWMDAFKSEITNEIIDTYLHFANSIKISEDPELLIELAGYIFYFDPVNEEAMMIKCRSLAYLGKHSQSKNTYENFCKEYKLLYNDDFNKSFSEVLQSPI